MYREPIVKWRKLGLKQFGPEWRNKIQLEQNEETRIQKNVERLRNLWDNYKCSDIQIIGVPGEEEGEEQEQEVENLFEKIMKNFPNLAKEIDFQEAQEALRVPNNLDPRKHTPRHLSLIHISEPTRH